MVTQLSEMVRVRGDVGPRRCAVSGASGYLGRRIRQRLQADGWTVSNLSRAADSVGSIEFKLGQCVDPRRLEGLDTLVHCAYDFGPARWPAIHSVNVVGSKLLMRAAKAAGVRTIVYISTISAFPGCRSLYGKGKLEVEAFAHGQGAWVLRPGLVYGENPGGMFGRLAAKIQASGLVLMPGPDVQNMYLVHEDDIAEAVMRCIGGGSPTAEAVPITVAHEKAWSFRAIVRAIAASLGKPITVVPVPWRLMWSGLYLGETLGLPMPFKSDSLVSLMHQNPRPLLNAADVLGLHCRPFEPAVKAAPTTQTQTA